MKRLGNSLLLFGVLIFISTFVACSKQDSPTTLGEMEIPMLHVVSTTPVGGGIWELKASSDRVMTYCFTVTFEEEILLLTDCPEGVTLVGDDHGEVLPPEGGRWEVRSSATDSKTIEVRLLDGNGRLAVHKQANERFVLTIPAGIMVCASDASLANGEIVFSFYDSKPAFIKDVKANIKSILPTAEEVQSLRLPFSLR